jgi:hypothetical protein
VRPTESTIARQSAAARIVGVACAIVLLAIALLFAATTLFAILYFAWRQPMFDQWRTYGTFLSLPFPDNILPADNGHRPIVPNFFRYLEIRWFAADQLLQITIGTLCMYLTCGAIAFCAWRERGVSLLLRAGGVLLAVLGVLWLGNARMQLHGNESLHAYLLTLCVVCACIWTWQARQTGHLRWLLFACIACIVATFCFGPGIASFAAVFLLGILLRVPLRWLAMPIGVAAICLVVYLFALPGNEGVRNVLDLHPLTSARVVAQWLSAPWVNGWLAAADPRAPWFGFDPDSDLSNALIRSANAVTAATGGDWRRLSIVIGALGIIGFTVRALITFLRSTPPTRLETVAIGVGAFAIAVAIVIGIARLNYLLEFPDQIYADRYLLWPCLFWSSLSLLVLCDIARTRSRIAHVSAFVFLIVLPAILLVTQRNQVVWGAVVYANAQRNAAALRSGVFDEPYFSGNGPDARADDLHTLDLLREHHLAMFADAFWERVGTPFTGGIDTNPNLAAHVHVVEPIVDVRNGKPALHFNGIVDAGIGTMQRDGQLAVLDDENTIVGLAEYSFLSFDVPALQLGLPRKRGFDGYVRDFDTKHVYNLVWLSGDHAVLLTPIKTVLAN